MEKRIYNALISKKSGEYLSTLINAFSLDEAKRIAKENKDTNVIINIWEV